MNKLYVTFLFASLFVSLHSKEQETTITAQHMTIDPGWGYLEAGKVLLKHGTTVITDNGCYRQPDEFFYYPEGYYRDGRACEEMMGTWLPADFEHIYLKNPHGLYTLLSMIKDKLAKKNDALIKWAAGAGAVSLASLIALLKNDFFPKISYKQRIGLFDASYETAPNNNTNALDKQSLKFIGLSCVGVISLVCAIDWAVKYYKWYKTKFLSKEDREKLMAAIENWPNGVTPDDYPLVAFEKNLTPGASEGLISNALVNYFYPNRQVTVYDFDPVLQER